jgi:hypothetical protein
MIYEMVMGCVADLRSRWGSLSAGLVALRDALPQPSNRRDLVAGLLARVDSQTDAIQNFNPRLTDQGAFADVPALLGATRAFLNRIRDLPADPGNPAIRLLPTLAIQLETLRGTSSEAEAVRAANEALARLDGLRQLIDRHLADIAELAAPEGQRASVAGIRDSVQDIGKYPVLTRETDIAGAPSSPAAGTPGGRPLGVVVENAVRDVLGWRPRAADPKGFLGALSQSFTCQEVQGRTQCTYTPRTYAVQVQADMGAVTGAQASIYARAKAALDQSVIILQRLYPLDPAAEKEEVEAARAIIRSEITELVNELGVEGGPRVQRVDALFVQLRGPEGTPFDPEQVQGQLRNMHKVFGLDRRFVNTIEQEQDLTDFLTLVDYVNSLKQSWDAQKRFFSRTGTARPFLGTQLVLLSRQLAVVAESVQEVNFALDSVFLGAAERQTTELTFGDGRPPIYVAELLAWVERFATEEAPRLIQDAGKAGVRAFFPTVDQLADLVRDARVPPQDPANLPEGYATPRVQRALSELFEYVQQTARLAHELTNGPGTGYAAHHRQAARNGQASARAGAP